MYHTTCFINLIFFHYVSYNMLYQS